MPAGTVTIRAGAYTSIAMLAFAGNSIICRMALRDAAIDPATFTGIRLASGALALLLILTYARRSTAVAAHGSWASALALFVYAICFSFAYISLDAASGALILFGFVQGTMIVMALAAGDRPQLAEWLGWMLAVGGLVWLLLPGATAPAPIAAALMALSGIAWGLYSIQGRGQTDALASTSSNFLRSLVLVAALSVLTIPEMQITRAGIGLAILSGAVTSGVGYVIWYAAMNYISAIQAALVQLSVPAIAAAGGVIVLAEPLSGRLVVAGLLILGGICVAIIGKQRPDRAP